MVMDGNDAVERIFLMVMQLQKKRLDRRAALALFCALFVCCTDNIDNGNLCLRLGDYPAAIEYFSAVLKRHPANFQARMGMGKALLQQGIDRSDTAAWRGALLHLEAARTLAPRAHIGPLLGQAWTERARMLLAAGDTLGGLDALTLAIERDKEAVAPINLAGIVYFRTGNIDKSLTLFRTALALDSTDAATRFNLGMVHWARGEAAGAHGHWLAALKANPSDASVLYWFALAEKRLREAPP
jgi:tetratricopeptide (TPR) repeat protein